MMIIHGLTPSELGTMIVIWAELVIIYILGMAWFLTRAKWLDLRRRYSEPPLMSNRNPDNSKPIAPAKPMRFDQRGGSDNAANLPSSTPPSIETARITRNVTSLPMYRIIDWWNK